MATTLMLQLATVILENEKNERDAVVEAQYARMCAATNHANANPNDYAAQIMSVLESDRMSHVSQIRDVEMQQLLGETREYLSRI